MLCPSPNPSRVKINASPITANQAPPNQAPPTKPRQTQAGWAAARSATPTHPSQHRQDDHADIAAKVAMIPVPDRQSASKNSVIRINSPRIAATGQHHRALCHMHRCHRRAALSKPCRVRLSSPWQRRTGPCHHRTGLRARFLAWPHRTYLPSDPRCAASALIGPCAKSIWRAACAARDWRRWKPAAG